MREGRVCRVFKEWSNGGWLSLGMFLFLTVQFVLPSADFRLVAAMCRRPQSLQEELEPPGQPALSRTMVASTCFALEDAKELAMPLLCAATLH